MGHKSNNLKFIVKELHTSSDKYLTIDGEFIRSNIEGNITPYKIILLKDSVNNFRDRVLSFIIHRDLTNEAYVSSLTLYGDSAYRTSYAIKLHTDDMDVNCEYIHFGLGEYNVPEQFTKKIKIARLKKYNK